MTPFWYADVVYLRCISSISYKSEIETETAGKGLSKLQACGWLLRDYSLQVKMETF
jgi:hypothetical protein